MCVECVFEEHNVALRGTACKTSKGEGRAEEKEEQRAEEKEHYG